MLFSGILVETLEVMSVGNEGRALLVGDGCDGPRRAMLRSLEVAAVEAEVIAQLLSAWIEGLVARGAIGFGWHGLVSFGWLAWLGWLVVSHYKVQWPARRAISHSSQHVFTIACYIGNVKFSGGNVPL